MRGGRYKEDPDPILTKINASIGVDIRLYRQDIEASTAHADMLGKQGIISREDADKLIVGLEKVLPKVERTIKELQFNPPREDVQVYREGIETSIAHAEMLGNQGIISREDADKLIDGLKKVLPKAERRKLPFEPLWEDIHSHVEHWLADDPEFKEVAGRLHTARSRNDQVATDFKLWVRNLIDDVIDPRLAEYQIALADKAQTYAATIMPGFTHLQVAQPVTLGHHLLAYVEMAARDRGRFADARRRLNECPLGSAALAGTSFPLDRTMTAEALKFDRPVANSLDAVSDRDFVIEALAAASIAAMHLSRFAEELVIWYSQIVGFIDLPQRLTTHSSIMPQKRNPDAAELVRAKTGQIFGALQALLVVMKGLPLAYQKDMQEDKESAMNALEVLGLCIEAMTKMVSGMTPNAERMREVAGQGFSTATDLADWLVKNCGMPFREAHDKTGSIVLEAEEMGKSRLEDVSLEKMQEVEERITPAVFKVLSVEGSVASRTSYGGTAPANVRREAEKWLEKLGKK
jgi:argininosuccinate lyase